MSKLLIEDNLKPPASTVSFFTSVHMIASHLVENIKPGAQANLGVCFITILPVLPSLT